MQLLHDKNYTSFLGANMQILHKQLLFSLNMTIIYSGDGQYTAGMSNAHEYGWSFNWNAYYDNRALWHWKQIHSGVLP